MRDDSRNIQAYNLPRENYSSTNTAISRPRNQYSRPKFQQRPRAQSNANNDQNYLDQANMFPETPYNDV